MMVVAFALGAVVTLALIFLVVPVVSGISWSDIFKVIGHEKVRLDNKKKRESMGKGSR